MKILIACEYSGTVRRAFSSLGHDVWSCDLEPSEDLSPKHIQQDVLTILDNGWDMMIAHPPCTDLATSGARWFAEKIKDGRQGKAIRFAKELWEADIPLIALENPVSILSTHLRKPDQIIQPWWFGHEVTKSTCLWLKGLPLLKPTNVIGKGEFTTTKDGRKRNVWHNQPPSPTRGKIRSKTFEGIALAMADQWGTKNFFPGPLDKLPSTS